MQRVAEANRDFDVTNVPGVVAGSLKLGFLEAIVVLLFSLASRFLGGPLETVVCGLILVAGLAAVTFLPGLWTRPRTIEGIAGAAGIGLGAAVEFLFVDVILLQSIGTYTNRWLAIGGGSNWWYHPVWWMTGTFLPWMGAWILANQAERTGAGSPVAGMLMALGAAVVLAVIAIMVHVPGAHWSLGTFGVAFLPGLALAALLSGLGRPST